MSQTQPKTTQISFKSLLSLPARLCNPPPAVAKVRSCGVVPVFQVQLDDILERKHLPPLGLKDFEEWLLYCEDSVENLYFILWLKDYTLQYKQWVARVAFERDNAGEYRMDWPLHFSSQLSMFYLRAKQTFFTPNAAYELNLPSVAFAPFHASNGSPHPDPAIFTDVAIETRKMLEESLARFVTAQFSNVGNQRVLCGMIAGVVFCLLGAVLPLVYNLALGRSRWLRLTSFPGMWLGLTVLLASLNGICVGVYIFGDLRQLRKFELSRPAISKPQPLNTRPTISNPIPSFTPVTPIVQPRLTIVPPSPAHIHSPHSPSRSSTSSFSLNSHSSYSGDTGAIHISPAYFDADDVDGPATSPATPDNIGLYALPPKITLSDAEGDFAPTAAFIHPFEHFPEDGQFGGPPRALPEERQILSTFNFDALPRCALPPRPARTSSQPRETRLAVSTKPRYSAKSLIGRLQSKCAPRWSWPATPSSPADAGKEESQQPEEKAPHRPRDSIDSSSRPHLDLPQHSPVRPRPDKRIMSKQLYRIKAVPAFSVPLTPVLSGVVVRGQRDIVIRSALLALFLCCVVIGTLLAVPPRRV